MTFAKAMHAFASTLVLSAASLVSAAAQGMAGVPQVYDGTMRPDVEVKTFEHSDELFPARVVERGSRTRKLPKAKSPLKNVYFEVGGKHYDLFDYLALNRVAGLVIMKNGEVVLEDYELGTGPETRWPSYSMAKSVSSTLIGAALFDGSIASLDDPVTKYVPVLKGGAYEGVSVRNVIQMASGVKWSETYTDPKSDRRKLLEIQLQEKPGTILPFMSGLGRAGAPGTIWNYNTGETFVVGAVLEGATHRPLADYLSEKIWKPWGMEFEAQWQLESPKGIGWAGGGLAATLLDFGRGRQKEALIGTQFRPGNNLLSRRADWLPPQRLGVFCHFPVAGEEAQPGRFCFRRMGDAVRRGGPVDRCDGRICWSRGKSTPSTLRARDFCHLPDLRDVHGFSSLSLVARNRRSWARAI